MGIFHKIFAHKYTYITILFIRFSWINHGKPNTPKETLHTPVLFTGWMTRKYRKYQSIKEAQLNIILQTIPYNLQLIR